MKAGHVFQVGTHSFLPLDVPDWCPHCQRHVSPISQWKYPVPGAQDTTGRSIPKRLQVVVLCPNRECLNLYIVDFELISGLGTGNEPFHMRVKGYIPVVPRRIEFSETLNEISVAFPDVYSQAMAAEQYGLYDIAGMGYRKALEFLVKDYAIWRSPLERDEIADSELRIVLGKWVQNKKVAAMAARAAWLGNDHSHYVRKWEHKDLDDLKSLLRVVLNWVLLEYETEGFIADMPRKK